MSSVLLKLSFDPRANFSRVENPLCLLNALLFEDLVFDLGLNTEDILKQTVFLLTQAKDLAENSRFELIALLLGIFFGYPGCIRCKERGNAEYFVANRLPVFVSTAYVVLLGGAALLE